MSVTVAYIEEEDRLDLVFDGNLDLTVSRDVCSICSRVKAGLRSCIIDLSAVARVFDSGVALLHLLYQRLCAQGTTVVLLGVHPELRSHIPFITRASAVVYPA